MKTKDVDAIKNTEDYVECRRLKMKTTQTSKLNHKYPLKGSMEE
jgi:hypothetical protein